VTLEQTIHNHLERLPAHMRGEVLDYVLFLEQKASRQSGAREPGREKLGTALDRLVRMNPFGDIDPVRWQQEQRQDRALPGRD